MSYDLGWGGTWGKQNRVIRKRKNKWTAKY